VATFQRIRCNCRQLSTVSENNTAKVRRHSEWFEEFSNPLLSLDGTATDSREGEEWRCPGM
jgi:hypothetical protein